MEIKRVKEKKLQQQNAQSRYPVCLQHKQFVQKYKQTIQIISAGAHRHHCYTLFTETEKNDLLNGGFNNKSTTYSHYVALFSSAGGGIHVPCLSEIIKTSSSSWVIFSFCIQCDGSGLDQIQKGRNDQSINHLVGRQKMDWKLFLNKNFTPN